MWESLMSNCRRRWLSQAVRKPCSPVVQYASQLTRVRRMAHSTPSAPAIEARHTFKYTPFTTNTNTIRILTLQPGQPHEPLEGHLSNEDLEHAEPYETVSYCWGAGGRCAELICGSEYLPVTQSAYDALRRIRYPDRPRRLWADQICINQDDVVERSRQVRLMNGIYQGSSRVLVWLGRDEEGMAEDAVKMVRYLTDVFGDETAHRRFRTEHSEGLMERSEDPWVPLSKLTQQPWFTRIWIAQEIGTGAPATLFWGTGQLGWEELSNVAGILNVHYHSLRTRFKIFTPNIRYLYQRFVKPTEDHSQFHNRGNFIYELHRARHMLSKDPRDRVYAFLGHFTMQTNGDALASMKADYSLTPEEVYVDVAIRGLRDAQCLVLLAACHKVNSPNRMSRAFKQRLELPSWVPDWRVLPLHVFGNPDTPNKACGDTVPKLEIDEDQRILHITGVRVDTVAYRYWIFHNKDFQMRHTVPRKSPLERLWFDIARRKPYSLTPKYMGGKDSLFFALIQTLTNACIGVDRTQPYQDIPASKWLASGAAYLMRTKADANFDDISPELQQLAQEGDAFKWSHEATLVTRYRRFATSSKGYFLLGSDMMQQGDAIVVLHGGKTPFLLRPKRNGTWALLGECYVHGLMNGEALELDAEEEIFSIT